MALKDNILQGSYKGFNFETYNSSKSQNIKTAIHSFPNSNKRIVESLGVEDAIFQISIVIYGADDHLDLRKRFETILNEETSGTLIHPEYGEIQVKVTAWSVNNNIQSELGQAGYSITFYEVFNNEQANPEELQNSGIKALNGVLVTNENLSEMVDETVVISNSLNYNIVNEKLVSFSESSTEIGKFIEDEDDLADFNKQIQDFTNNISTFLSNPSVMGSNVKDIFSSLEAGIDEPLDRFNAFQSLFTFGDEDVFIPLNTTQRIERDKNNKVLKLQIQGNALNVAANAISDIDYNNDEDLKEADNIINTQFDKVLTSFNEIEDIIFIDDVYNNFVENKTLIAAVFRDKSQITPRIINITPTNSSIALLNYQYYDNLDKYDQIADLNIESDFYFINGATRILENV